MSIPHDIEHIYYYFSLVHHVCVNYCELLLFNYVTSIWSNTLSIMYFYEACSLLCNYHHRCWPCGLWKFLEDWAWVFKPSPVDWTLVCSLFYFLI